MSRLLARLANSEDGAVTVDWVVITAAIVVLASLLVNGIREETSAAAERVGTKISEVETL